MGIPAGDRDRVFDMFVRAHSTDDGAGTGIGLATCRRIIEHHNGDIHAEDGCPGTTIVFTLPHADTPDDQDRNPTTRTVTVNSARGVCASPWHVVLQ